MHKNNLNKILNINFFYYKVSLLTSSIYLFVKLLEFGKGSIVLY